MPAIFAALKFAFAAILGWFATLGGAAVGAITIEGAKFFAYRALTFFILGVVVPILIYNVATDFIIDMLNIAMQLSVDNTSGFTTNLVLSFSSLGGWIAQQIALPQALSIYISAVSVRFIMNLIPFIK